MEDRARKPVDPQQRKRLVRKATQQRLVRQLSKETLKSPMAPDHVIIESKNEETGEVVRKKVYVTEVNGTRSLDLYSGWNPETEEHKMPLKTLPPKVCLLDGLERLWISHNKLTALPDQLERLVHLKELYLHRNCFESVPLQLCKLPKLEILWLNSNKISRIPPEIAQLKSLKRLHLDHNFIEEFSDFLCQLTSLEVLYLNDNVLHSISGEIDKLSGLTRLYLQNNKIPSIPKGVCTLQKIVILNLDGNEITHVKRDFQQYQAQKESEGKLVSTKYNPFVTPGSKLKLSVGSMHRTSSFGTVQMLKTRRHSDQYERAILERRHRVSLPEGELHIQLGSFPRRKVPSEGYPKPW